ncbi:CocE/NonD family hydrolase [Actinophytocola sp.]|uniref:CocE/NonD family hydrolase n=1 Tax=Actinophytocola sp. TaxID=1872138 RepID=UPI002EDA7E56
MEAVFPDRQFGLAASVQAAQLTDALVPFFDRWLRGREDALDGAAPVRIFVMGIAQWRDEQDWPLPDTADTDYYLASAGRANTADGDGALTGSPPEAAAPDTFLYDPRRPVPSIGGVNLNLGGFNGPADQRPVESRGDVLVFSTPLLTDPVEVTGPVTLTLFVSSSAVDTDFTGKLVDVHPDGRAIILCEGIQRMRYRDSLAQARFMTPGQIYEITIDLTATSNVFLAGHRIRLEVSSSNFPRYDRNSNTGGVIATEREQDMTTAVNHVHHGPNQPSRLTLPLLRR